MKIRGLFIERFGALRDFEVGDLQDGLTVFVGPNGSGKSTLFTFLREILFGRGEPDEQPAGRPSDEWTGRIQCAVSDVLYTVARRADRPHQRCVTGPNGEEHGDAAFQNIFRGADSRLLASLLMFDARDLQAPAALSASAVRGRLNPVGLGRLRTIQRALDAIESRKAEVAQRADHDAQRLPALAAELHTRLENSTRAAGRLGQVLGARAQARLALDRRTRTVSELKKEVAHYKAILDLAPVWQELTQARRELETTDPIDDFPADPEGRLERALTAREAARRSAEQLEDVRESRATAVSMPVPSLPVPAQAPPSESGISWQQRWKEAAEAVCERERELEAATRIVRELEAARTQVSHQPEPPSRVVLDEEARLFQQVRTTLEALAEDQASTKRWQDAIAEHSRTIRTLETESVPVPSPLLHWVGGCAALAGVAAAGWRQAAGDPVGSSALVVCAIASAAGAFVQRLRRASAFDEDTTRQERLEDLRTQLEEACQNLLRHQEHAARRSFDISVDCARLGLPPMPSVQQLQARQAELVGQRQKRDDWDNAQTGVASTMTSLARAEEQRRQHLVAFQAAQDHERQTIQQWYQWKVDAIDNVGGTRGSADSVRAEAELLDNCRRLKIQISEYGHSAEAWNARARSGVLGGGAREGHTAAVAEYATQTRVTVALEQSPAHQAARRRLRQCEESLAQLFSQAGVSDETAFRSRLAAYRRRQALAEKVRACESQSNERLRGEPAAEAIRRALIDGQVDDWSRRAAETAQELASVEAARDEAQRRLGHLEEDVRAASAESTDLPALEAERSGWATEDLATARDWRTLALAASLLGDASHHFERECVPPALRRASKTFSAVTLLRYERLALAEDDRELRVLDVKHGWKRVSELSRSTLEQLHFSLRLGLAGEAAPDGPWPLVVDDVLEHLDPQRERATAGQIVELSRRHQTFVLTRRPETCDLLRSLDPTARVITMQEL